MSEIFNPMPASLSQALGKGAPRERRSADQIAVEALECGFAFDEADDAQWSESSQLEEALQAFTGMGRK